MFRVASDLVAGLEAHIFPDDENPVNITPPVDTNDFAIDNPAPNYGQSLSSSGSVSSEFVADLGARLLSEEEDPANLHPQLDINGHTTDKRSTQDPQVLAISDATQALADRTVRSMFVLSRTKVILQGNLFPGMFGSSDDHAWAWVMFDLPEQQRSNLVLDINLPRDMNRKVNPLRLRVHCIRVTIPAAAISNISSPNQVELDDDLRQVYVRHFGILAEELLDKTGAPFQLGLLNVTASMAYISGATLPTLANSELQTNAINLIRVFRTASATPDAAINMQFAIHCHDDTDTGLGELADYVQRRVASEAQVDPATYWIQDSPNMENLVGPIDRPPIPCQGMSTVFFDRKEYLIAQIYGNLLEEEFKQMTLKKLEATTFDLILMESPIAVNPADRVVGNSIYSPARAYIGFLALQTDRHLARPDVGTRLKVQFCTLDRRPAPTAGPDHDEKIGTDEYSRTWDNDDDHAAEPTEWFATVIEPMAVSPKGHLTVVLHQPQELGSCGRRQNRLLQQFVLPTVNF